MTNGVDVGAVGGISAALARVSQIQTALSAVNPTAPTPATSFARALADAMQPTVTTRNAAAAAAAGQSPALAAWPAFGPSSNASAASAAPIAGLGSASFAANTAAITAAAPANPNAGWVLPVHGRITSPFGMRTHPVTGVYKLHTGTDFAATAGTRVGAAAAGVVVSARWENGNGNTVVVDHGNGITTKYAHASKLLVTPGERVDAGQAVIAAGSTGFATGPHLHLEVRDHGQPVDPLPWLRQHGVEVV